MTREKSRLYLLLPAYRFFCLFFNNTCHLIVLSLSYLHRYSWVPHSSPAETYWFFVFYLFLMCYHIVFLKNYIYNHNAPSCLLPGVNTQLESTCLKFIKLLMFLESCVVSQPYSSTFVFVFFFFS